MRKERQQGTVIMRVQVRNSGVMHNFEVFTGPPDTNRGRNQSRETVEV